jgi:hypothetical protein
MDGQLVLTRQIRTSHRILISKAERKRTLGGHTLRMEDNIKTEFKETECDSLYSIQHTQDRV